MWPEGIPRPGVESKIMEMAEDGEMGLTLAEKILSQRVGREVRPARSSSATSM